MQLSKPLVDCNNDCYDLTLNEHHKFLTIPKLVFIIVDILFIIVTNKEIHNLNVKIMILTIMIFLDCGMNILYF